MKIVDKLNGLKPCFHGSITQEGVLDFSTNIYPVSPPDEITAEIVKALDDVGRYPDSESSMLREEISRKYDVLPEGVIVGNGSTELIRFIGFCFGSDGISFIPQPTFGEYEYSILLYGGRVVSARIPEENNFVLTGEVLGEMPANTGLVFLCNPNNPTGRVIPKNTIYSFLEETNDKDILVVIDEVYYELSDSYSLIEKTAEFENLIVLRSLTKAYGLCGLRIGYAIANKRIIEILDKARPPWNVNVITQKAALACINHHYIKEIEKESKKSKEVLRQELEKFPLRIYPSETNFLLVNIKETGYSSPQFTRLLLNKGIYIRDCSSFPYLDEDYVRIGVKTSRMNEILIEKLEEVLGE